jgi:hypothetical protein
MSGRSTIPSKVPRRHSHGIFGHTQSTFGRWMYPTREAEDGAGSDCKRLSNDVDRDFRNVSRRQEACEDGA